MKCANCGKKLKSNEKFCTYCGYYNDNENEETFSKELPEEDLIEENWYEEELTNDEETEEVELEPVKKEKKKKEKKPKEEKIKVEKPKKEKKEKTKPEIKEIKIKETNEVYDKNERYIEAYIGEDYKLIKRSPFNIWAFLLNWMYLLYRKLYITGVIGLVITAVVAFFFTKYFLIYFLVSIVVLGFVFNPYYIYIVKGKVNKILEEYEGTDSFSLEKMCNEFGGVNVPIALIIYLTFLIVIVLSILKPTVNTAHNSRFWKENSENEANCLSLVKLIYQKSNSQKISEALCKVNKNNKNYDLYIKINKNNKVIYEYYTTENDYIVYKNNTEALEILTKKKQENKISVDEEKTLSEIKLIINNYEIIHNKSIEEDKLIEKKRNKEEKLNYIIEYEKIIR